MLVSAHRPDAAIGNSHEGPAQNTDEDHRKPAGHLSEGPVGVSERNGSRAAGDEAIKGVEWASIGLGLLVLRLCVYGNDIGGSDRSAVQANVADRCILLDGWNQEVIDGWRSSSPNITKDRLCFAVQDGKLRAGGDCGES